MSDTPNLPRGLIGRRGTPTGKSARLPSIRGPRDLTLGGVPKKSFAPSIPVRKDRTKSQGDGASISTAPETTGRRNRDGRPDRGRGGRGRGRGRGRDDNILQSHSIFEQGPTERLVKSSSFGENYGGRASKGASTSRTSIKKEIPDGSDTKKVLDTLLRDDFIDDLGEKSVLTPVFLPLSQVSIKEEIKKEKLKPKIEIKNSSHSNVDDPTAEPDIDMVDAEGDNSVSIPDHAVPGEKDTTDSIITVVKKERRPDLTSQQIFSEVIKSEHGELLFFQLPDVLPGVPPSKIDEDIKPPVKDKSGGATSAQKQSEKNEKGVNSCKLKDFSEGHIGKLQVRKSGKTQLILGNIVLDVLPGTPCSFLQEAVSVKLGEDGGGQMTVLGQVEHKLTCIPDFEQLLGESS